MTDDALTDAEALRRSWDRIRPDELSLNFYASLFRVHPSIRARFPLSMRAQRHHLVRAIDAVVETADDLQAAVPLLETLGRKHARLVRPGEYELVGYCLLANIEHEDMAAGPTTLDAWGRAYGFVASTMSAAGDAARDEVAPQWYEVTARWCDGYTSRLILTAELDPVPAFPVLLASPLGRPGMWVPVTPLPSTAGELHHGDRSGGYRHHIEVPIVDTASRALALLRPGQRVALAPEVS